MWSLEVVVTQPGAERPCASPRARIRDGIGPATGQCLDEAFRFPVGLRAVGARAPEPDSGAVRSGAKRAAQKDAAIVGQHLADCDASARKPAECADEKARGGDAGLLGEDLDVRGATVIIHRNKRIFVAGAVDFAAAVAMDAMAHAENAREGFDVEMYEFARVRALIANHRETRGEIAQTIEPGSRQNRRDG